MSSHGPAGARGAFELFLDLAHRFLESNGEPVLANHKAMCRACGLDPDGPHSPSAVSRLLRSLRNTFGVIDYEPLQRRRPQIRLAPAHPVADILNPRHYIYFAGGWNGRRRAVFDVLGPRAFSAEYMYWIAEYESALARAKHGRSYWFFPLEKISKMYRVSVQFAGTGLRGLVELGIMRVMHGQFGLRRPITSSARPIGITLRASARSSGGSGSSRIWKASTGRYSRLPRPWR